MSSRVFRSLAVAAVAALAVACTGDDDPVETTEPPIETTAEPDVDDPVDDDGTTTDDTGDDDAGTDASDDDADDDNDADADDESSEPGDDGAAEDPFAVPDDPDVAYYQLVITELFRAQAEGEQSITDGGGVVDARSTAWADSLFTPDAADAYRELWQADAERGLFDPDGREAAGLVRDHPPKLGAAAGVVSSNEATGCVGLEVEVDLTPLLAEGEDRERWQYFGLVPHEEPDEINATPWKIASIQGNEEQTRDTELTEVTDPCGG